MTTPQFPPNERFKDYTRDHAADPVRKPMGFLQWLVHHKWRTLLIAAVLIACGTMAHIILVEHILAGVRAEALKSCP